jgi:hypothetical protein
MELPPTRSPSGRARLLAAGTALLLAALAVAGPIAEAVRLEDQLSPLSDPYSESNALRSALAVLAEGWTANAGLPETTFGGLHPEAGHLHRFGGRQHVDTHYPPGPTWLVAATQLACGERPVSCLRSLPIVVSALGAFLLAFALLSTLGMLRGLAVTLAAFSPPLYSSMMMGLHYQGHALALLSIQLAALLWLFASGRPLAARDLALAGGLGFVQGWLSFDYFFLVALAPLPLAVLFTDLREREQRRRLVALVLAGGAGFAFAHALHFLQVAAYLGGVAAAADDLLGVALERADPALSSDEQPPDWVGHPWMISSIYLFTLSHEHFGFNLGNALLLALFILVALRDIDLALPGTGVRLEIDPSARPAWAVVSGLLVSCAWISLMPGHAYDHAHFIPRHLFLLWLVMGLALVRSLRLVDRGTGAGASSPS